MRLSLLLLFLSIHYLLLAQDEAISGARAMGLGGSGISLKDVWAVENNPALIGETKHFEAGISYRSNYHLSQLSNRSLAFVIPVSGGSFGAYVNQFGFSAYNENRMGLAYGKQLAQNFSMGIQLTYLSTQISEGYGQHSALSATIGMQVMVSEKLALSTVIVNPNRAKLNEFEDERYPSLLRLGSNYQVAEKVRLLGQLDKDIDWGLNVRAGIEYQAIERLIFRLGYATDPALSSFGFGLLFSSFQLDFASGFDSKLGFTPTFSISYIPQQEKR
jgi:hypothetical protein